MESLVLEPLLHLIFEKLASLFVGTVATASNFKEGIKRLEDKLLLIQAVIQHAEERQVRDPGVGRWLRKLQSIAYDSDDLLDRIHTENLRRQTGKKVPILSNLFPKLDSFGFSRQLKGIESRIGDLASDISLLGLRNEVLYRRYETSERRQTGTCVDQSEVVGREEDLREIVRLLLLSTSSDRTLSILPIVGMGGVGKTTLAQLVYRDPDVQRSFDLKIWISVGDNFNVRKLIRDILEYAGQKDLNGSQLPQLGLLQSRLQELLRGRNYLLILDDVWNESETEWSKLREPLRCGNDGSKIVVTTRSQRVAALMGTHDSYTLKPLSDDNCWALFQQTVFSNGGGGEADSTLTGLGKEIVRKCGGIPLAAKVLGSILRSHRDERDWSNVLKSEIWNLRDDSILLALRLTYNHLPPNQKRCFAYCSVFPSNSEISREKLIQLWIAEGMIPSPNDSISSKNMEDIANEYFDNLVWMSLFQGVSYSDDGRIAEFRVHSLIHDLALSVCKPNLNKSSQEELFTFPAERRAYVMCNALSPATIKSLHFEKLRTLHLICPGNDLTEALPSIFKNLRRLRVLTLSNCGITILHKSVSGLIYLRYLDLSDNLICSLPETICHLLNLQTLNLSSCHTLKELPTNLSNLVSLRHLNIENCVNLSQMPAFIMFLKNLQTLPMFIVGQDSGRGLYQLSNLYLRGKLKIKHLENCLEMHPLDTDGYLRFKQLHTLSLSWRDEDEGKVGHNANRRNVQGDYALDVLHCLVPSDHYLRVLQINGYGGVVLSEWINKLMLPNLTKLVLVNCRRCETLPTLGQFPFLKYLKMQGMDEVVKITDKFNGIGGKQKPFPCLNELILKDFAQLSTWETMESVEAFPSLQKVVISKCPRLISMPRFPSLQHLDMHDCHDLLLRSASTLTTLSHLVIDVCQEASFIPKFLFSNNSRLTSLKISSCPKLRSLPASIRSLTTLKSLSIRFCETLETFPREMLSLTNLEALEITECPGLSSLPNDSIQGLTSLQSLSIENCINLNSLPLILRNLTALEHLTVMYCPNLACLPDVMQEFQSLQSLNIVECTSLKSLPSGLQHVSSLNNLEIRGCPELQELPDWIGNLLSLRSLAISDCKNIKVLPEGIRRLKELQHLSIIDCPDLEARCQAGTGEDWHKISHIPFNYVRQSSSLHGDAAASSSSKPTSLFSIF